MGGNSFEINGAITHYEGSASAIFGSANGGAVLSDVPSSYGNASATYGANGILSNSRFIGVGTCAESRSPSRSYSRTSFEISGGTVLNCKSGNARIGLLGSLDWLSI